MGKIDYRSSYETLLIEYQQLLKENIRLKDENNHISINERRKWYGLPPINNKEKPQTLKYINLDYNLKNDYYDHLDNKEVVLDITTLKHWVNKIIDYLE